MRALVVCFTLAVVALVHVDAQDVTQSGTPAPASPESRVATDPQSVRSLVNPNARPVPIDNLYYTRGVYGAAWSPDGRDIAFTSNIAGRFNLWRVPAAGGWPVQITQSDDVQSGAVWSPDGKWILFHQDAAGNELYDVYAVPSDGGGTIVNLTNTPKVTEENPRWSPDGSRIAIDIKAESAAVYDLALIDWRTHAVRRLTNETAPDRNWAFVAWSPDGKTVYANRREVSLTDVDVYSIDAASNRSHNLTPHEGKARNRATSLSPDGRTLLLTSNARNGAFNVALLDVATEKLSWVTDVKWEAESRDFSPDGKSFTYTINADGRFEAFVADRATGRPSRVAVPAGVNTFEGLPTFSPRGDRLIVSHQSSTQPPDLWLFDLPSRTARQLTVSAISSLKATPLPESQVVHYKTFDGKIISALMWMPFNLERNGSNPAIVVPHGGPTWQMSDVWNTDVTALVSRGYIVIAPNVRGSTGYGIEFQRANYQDLGGGDLQDEVYAARFLQSTGYVDAKRIGIMGGSYGGFMTLMAVGKAPDVWASAVAQYGIIDWRAMVKFSDPLLQQYIKSLLGDPVKDSAVYDATSPIKFIHAAKAPLLVLQGDNDPRVPKEQAKQVVDLLKADGKTVEVTYYPNEGHGFQKRENQIDAITRSIEWMDRYLKERKPTP
jgi:dipeptidyl aminopeptidase/acylaminoacyl peptidase